MKTFSTSGTGNQQTLSEIESDKIPIYNSVTDAESDLANLEEGQIIGTKDEGSELSAPVDVVQSGNMHAVTSNAVAGALSYSTTEHFTGRYWHNGKKIYEKTYNLTDIVTDGRSYSFDVSALNIDEVTKYEGYINRTVQSGGDLVVIQYDWNFWDVNNTWGCIFRQKTPSQDIVMYRANITDSITTTGVISLYYTKTTD